MAKLIFADYSNKCSNCNNSIFLPGIVPTSKMLYECGWKYCPYCGEKIEYSQDKIVKDYNTITN